VIEPTTPDETSVPLVEPLTVPTVVAP